jgi:hypothetical protein
MSYIDLDAFDTSLLRCEIVNSKNSKPGEKPKLNVRLTYGPARRAVAFVTPATVVDWPKIEGEGNFGSKYGPDTLDKAAFTMGLTDKPIDGTQTMAKYFDVLRAIDSLLVEFVHANQKELLGARDMSRDEVRGKLSPTVKPKYDDDILVCHKQNLSTRKFTWNGEERHLRIVDCNRAPLTQPVRHEDVCMVAVQLDAVYTGLMGCMYGCKWAICEVMLLKRASNNYESRDDPFANHVPAWAVPETGAVEMMV